MKFLDANVFIYAYYKPKHKLSDKERELKEKAKKIIKRINEGEEVVTSIVHISEISNMLKRALPLNELYSLLIGLFSFENIKIVDITKEDYIAAIELIEEIKLGPNDCLAIVIMEKEGINEIYTFDKGFDRIPMIKRVY